jgi:PAS domain S-box-containing protein
MAGRSRPFSISRLRTRLVLLTLIAVTPALLVVAGLQFLTRDRMRDETLESYTRSAVLVAAQVATAFETLAQLLDTVGHVPVLRLGGEPCRAFLESAFRAQQGAYTNLIVFSPDGSPICSANGVPPTTDVYRRAGFQRALATSRTTLGEPIGAGGGRLLVAVIHPVLDATGRAEYVITAGVSLERLNQQLAVATVLPGVTIAITDRQANLLAQHPNDSDAPAVSATTDGTWHALSDTQGTGAPADVSASLWQAFLVPTRFDAGLVLTMSLDPAIVFAGSDRLFWWQAGLLAVLTLLVTAAGLAAGDGFVLRPVRSLSQTLDRLAGGNLEARAELDGGAPGIGEIGEAVSGMADALAERMRALVASESLYRHLFEEHPHPLFIYDADTLALLAVNQATADQYGYSREVFSTLTLADLHLEADAPAVRATYEGELRRSRHTWHHRTREGRSLDVLLLVTPVPWQGRQAGLALAENVTERTRLEAELRQAQKLKALGQLAGGVAHDFNNLLTAILGYSNLVADALPPGDASRADISEVIDAANRAASLTRQLLAFGRKQILAPDVLTLGDHMKEVAPMIERLVGEQIRVTVAATDTGRVTADPTQLTQVIMNLAVNARDAMPGGGTLHIDTADLVTTSRGGNEDAVPPGAYVTLTVRDSGCGMDAATAEQVFEPFFTTRPLGHGTGLGLATVHGIVTQSGGHVSVRSAPGQGTTFTVLLPRAEEDARAPRPQHGTPEPTSQAGPDSARTRSICS